MENRSVHRSAAAVVLLISGVLSPVVGTTPSQRAAAQEPPSAGIRFSDISAPASVAAFKKFEITFQVKGTSATNFQFPFDPNPPPGVNASEGVLNGISVDAAFTPDDWRTVYRQPAFFSRLFEDGGSKTGWDGSPRAWQYPTGTGVWKVRFTPHRAGVWQYTLFAVDASGSAVSPAGTFSVGPSAGRGFIRVSKRDPRYFEFDDGTTFLTPGVQTTVKPNDPPARIEDVKGGVKGSHWGGGKGDHSQHCQEERNGRVGADGSEALRGRRPSV